MRRERKLGPCLDARLPSLDLLPLTRSDSSSATPMTSRWSLPEDDQPAPSTSVAAPSALLTEPVLFVDGIIEAVPDAKIVEALWECLKVR